MADPTDSTAPNPNLIDCTGSDSNSSESYVAPAEDPYTKSICYLERHNILQLFKNLTSDVIYNRPNDPLEFLIKEVQQLKQHRDQSAEKST